MNIDLTPVKSSQIFAVGYDAPSETLALQFLRNGQPGGVYHYTPVPDGMYHALLAAESIGKFFGANIKGKPGIKYTRIESQKEAEPNGVAAA